MTRNPPEVRPPTEQQVREVAKDYHLELTDEEVAVFLEAIEQLLSNYSRIDEIAPLEQPTELSKRKTTPESSSDFCNAFATSCSVSENDTGPLSGYAIGLKDNIALAGIEMRCGSQVLEGYIPDRDATIVSRLLGAGGTITGKLNMESMAKSGSGDLSDEGPVLNPRNTEYLAGGSSSGSAAAVVTGDVDVAIGTDQGGSVRIPAAWCGCVGHKPTHGLVPYTGIVGIGHTFDHAGPLATTVEDCAKVLEVIAGYDKYDPRQSNVHTEKYTEFLTEDPEQITIGRLSDGFGLEESEKVVDDRVETAISEFESAGAIYTDVSIPLHQDGGLLWTAINYEAVAALVQSEGLGYFSEGYYDTTFLEAFGTSRRVKADQFSPTLKMSLIVGRYLSDQYLGRYHAQAQNLRRKLRTQYDAALQDVDVLALPTVPKTAHQYIENKSLEDTLDRATDMASNTAPFDITGHPAITVPCGTANGLPVGIMFVGERYDDGKVLQAAKAFEANVQTDLPKTAEIS